MTRLHLRVERERYEPGEVVRGTVEVVEGGSSRALEARLEYVEETDDYSEIATSVASGALHQGDLAADASFGFELALPADALPNLESEHGRLYWQVDVKCDRRGRDVHERRRLQVG